jgi:rhomboid protease GluP
MSSEDSPPATPRNDGRAWQRLVAALLAERAGDRSRYILQLHQAEAALLLARDATQQVTLLSVAHLPADTLRKSIAAQVSSWRADGPELHAFLVGGDADVARTLRQVIPPAHHMRLYHVDDAGTLHRLAAPTDPDPRTLLPGVRELPDLPLTREQLDAALAETTTLQRAAAGLRGSVRVTATITAVCVVLTALEYWWMGAGKLAVFAAMGANNGAAVAAGEVWRLFASAFLHGDVFHLLVNMYALWIFGTLLESLLGARRYILLYGLSALGGSLASAMFGSAVWSVGASGAIWGLMAAGLAVAYWPRDLLPPDIVDQLRKRAWVPLVLNLVYSFQPGIDIFAHVGGGVVGFLLIAGALTRGLKPLAEREHPGDAERGPNPLVNFGAAAIVLAMALSVFAALAVGRPWQLGGPLEYRRAAIGDTGYTAELPERIADQLTIEDKPGARLLQFGKITEFPVLYEFIVIPLPPDVGPEQAEAILEQERAAADLVSPPDFTRVAPAARVTLAGRPAVLVEHKLNDLTLRTHVFVFPRHELVMRRYALGDVPTNWAPAEEKIAASLQSP